MPTNIISSGTTQVQSADITLAAGEEVHIHLFADAGENVPPVKVEVLSKNAAGAYTVVAALDETSVSRVVSGAGTWAVRRRVCQLAVGVDRD